MASSILFPPLNPEDFPGRRVMHVEEFLGWAGISRWKFYDLVKNKQIHPRKIGSRTVIPVEEAERWFRELPELGPDQSQSA